MFASDTIYLISGTIYFICRCCRWNIFFTGLRNWNSAN